MNGIAHNKESEEAWEELLGMEDQHDSYVDMDMSERNEELVDLLSDIVYGYENAKALGKPADTAQLVKTIDEDNYRSWAVVSAPFEGHATHHHVNRFYGNSAHVSSVIDDIRKTANECASIERNNRKERDTAYRCLDRAKRMLSWLEPTAEDYYGVPRIKAIAKLIKAETGILTEEERDEPGEWRDDFIGQVAIAYK